MSNHTLAVSLLQAEIRVRQSRRDAMAAECEKKFREADRLVAEADTNGKIIAAETEAIGKLNEAIAQLLAPMHAE